MIAPHCDHSTELGYLNCDFPDLINAHLVSMVFELITQLVSCPM
jgi:hypothetical protein